jgi:hypothetical protein
MTNRGNEAMPNGLPFDVIEIDEGETRRRITPSQLALIPLRDRVRLLLEGRMRFLDGDRLVDVHVALRALRRGR